MFAEADNSRNQSQVKNTFEKLFALEQFCNRNYKAATRSHAKVGLWLVCELISDNESS